MFNAVKGFDELVSARAIIFSRLGGTGVKIGCGREDMSHMNDTNREENADPSKYDIRWWIYLKRGIRIEIFSRKNILIFTSPTLWPTVSENASRTFTVGITHLVSLLSPFSDWLNVGISS
jgi:hypothetical protein